MMYYSQSGQDKWVVEFFNSKENGFFIEVGAYDGIQTSNTYTLEKHFNWSGICIEADPKYYQRLSSNRKSKNVNIAVSENKGKCYFANDKVSTNGVLVDCDNLNNILLSNDCPNKIDYLSLDIEGHEFVALNSLDFDRFIIGLITVEHNLYSQGDENKKMIHELLTKKGFTRVVEDVVCQDKNPLYYNKPYEDWYVNNNLLK